MHKASIVLAAGADFRLLGPDATMLRSHEAGRRRLRDAHRLRQEPDQPPGRPDRCSTRASRSRSSGTRCRTATSRRCASSASRRSRTSTPRTRRSRSARSTRSPVRMGMVMYAGVDYEAILRAGRGGGRRRHLGRRQQRLPVLRARSADRRRRPAPARARARSTTPARRTCAWRTSSSSTRSTRAEAHNVEQVVENVDAVNPMATIVFAKSPPTLEDGAATLGRARPRRRGRADDHPRRDAVRRRARRGPQRGRGQDRRPAAVRRRLDRRTSFAKWPQLTNVLPAMGYSDEQLPSSSRRSTRPTATSSSPARRSTSARLITSRHPIRHVRYELEEVGTPTLADVLEPIVTEAKTAHPETVVTG